MNNRANTRVWLFQADRILTASEELTIQARLDGFIKSWFTHGHKLSAQGAVKHNLVIAIAIDQEVMSASGCSIDKMTHLIQEIGQDLQIDFFNRQNVAILKEGMVELHHFQDIQSKLKSGALQEDDLILDNLVDNGSDLDSNWLKPISKSWLNRFITV